MNVPGFIALPSSSGFAVTAERLEAAIAAKGLTLFAKIDHAAGAASMGLSLRPTVLLVFGSARAGTPLMQASPTIAIDLPLKALVWEDDGGKAWLGYNDPEWVAVRHGAGAPREIVANMQATISGLAQLATS